MKGGKKKKTEGPPVGEKGRADIGEEDADNPRRSDRGGRGKEPPSNKIGSLGDEEEWPPAPPPPL